MSATNLTTQRHQQRKRAFADATAGVVGSLAAMLAFYPVDVWKTSLQAYNNATARSVQCKDDDGILQSAAAIIPSPTTIPKTITRLFRGLPYKIAHTIASSFTYWFVYSLLQTKYAAYQLHYHHVPSRTTIESSPKSYSSGSSSSSRTSTTSSSTGSVVTKLLLTAVAAMINTGITLPLDTISSRRQVTLTNDDDDDDDDDDDRESKNSKSLRRQDQPPHPNQQQRRRRLQEQTQQQLLQSILSLWNGLLPALMLCTNPAIQHTLYDTLKAAWLVRRRYRAQTGGFWQQQQEPVVPSSPLSNNPKRRQHSLSMPEAFACGVTSKFIATMITYPLIRCKVMLMVSPSHSATRTARSSPAFSTETSTVSTDGEDGGGTVPESAHEGDEERSRKLICSGSDNAQGGDDRHEGTRINLSSSSSSSAKLMTKYPHPHSLPLLLLHIYKHEGGLRGIYRGCSVQLLHAVLKSAFLMMVRERITYASHRFFRIEES